jgi:citrate lyase beta subunit
MPTRSTVRVNPASSDEGAEDLQALIDLRAGARLPAGLNVVVPKVDDPDDVQGVRGPLEEAGWRPTVVAMVETARGLEAAAEIAGAPGVVALFLGGVDLAAELGCALTWDALLYARGRLVHAAALAGGVGLLDVPDLDMEDVEGLEARTRAVADLGFTGKSAVHPRQIEPIHAALAPAPGEVDGARRLLDAYHRGGGGVVSFEGIMVDRPVAEAARRVLWRADQQGKGPERTE